MQAYLTITHDPFHPLRGREHRIVTTPMRIRDLAPVTPRPIICFRNGEPLLRKDWDDRVIDGEFVVFTELSHGGGGSNPMRFILMIAVMAFAGPLASGLLGTTFGAYAATALGSTGLFLSVATAAIGLGGMMLINALIPPPKQNFSGGALNAPSASPTYNLQAQGNMARLESAIPVQYGRLKFFPDFGAQPYAEYYNNEQYLYQLFVLGQGYFDIESVNIEDTAISSWSDISYEVIEPGGTLTLFPSNVTTSGEVSGQTMRGRMSGTYNQTGTTTVTVTITDHLLSTGDKIYFDATTGNGDDGQYTVTYISSSQFSFVSTTAETASGACTVDEYVGPFVANAAGDEFEANALGIDVVLPRGLYYFDTSGNVQSQTVTFEVSARTIDEFGSPVGSWVVIGSEMITAATTTPVRRSYRYDVTPDRYQVQVRRTNVAPTESTKATEIVWAGLRAYLKETRDFGNITMIAMRLKASDNLSMQSSRKINVVGTRKINTWHPDTGWSASPVATRSIAWAIADVLKASYGGGLADSRIDLDGLYALDQVWAARGDTFDGRIDNTDTVWNSISQIAICGRAKPYIQGGIVHVVRDEAVETPVALFSMRNIVKGSFSVEYILPSEATADAVEVTYLSDVNWAPARVTAYLPGSTQAKPAKINLLHGATNRDQAHREGMYYAAANVRRRKIIKFATEMEGFIPSFGDLIAVQHDMPQWGQFAEVVAQESVENLLSYSEQIDNSYYTKTYMTVTPNAINGPDGTLSMDKLVETAITGEHRFVRVLPATANQEYTVSIFAKAGERTGISVQWRRDDGAAGAFQQFDLSAGTVTGTSGVWGTTSTLISSSIRDCGDGIYECKITAKDSTSITQRAYVAIVGPTQITNYLGDGTSGIYASGVQVVLGSSKPYVKTTTSSRGADVLTLTEDLVWDTTGAVTHYIGVRNKDGSLSGPFDCTWSDTNKIAVNNLNVAINTTRDFERTHISFGPSETWRQEARVISIRPRGLEQVEIECVNEDDTVHTAEDGIVTPPPQNSQLATLYTAPSITGLVARSDYTDVEVVLLSWDQAQGAEYYIIEQSASSAENAVWTRVAETRANNFSFRVLYGNATYMRVCAVGLTKGPWVTVGYGSAADYMWDANSATLMWGTSTDFMWR